MSEAKIDRVRQDLAVMCEAAGLSELPFGWEDVWMSLALVPCGLVLSAVGAVRPLNEARLGVIPVLALFGAAVVLRYRYRRSTGRSPQRRREYDLGLGAGIVFAAVAGGYLAWARSLGQPVEVMGGLAVAMTGGFCAVLGATTPGRRSCFAAAAALIVYGLTIPFCTPRQVVIGGGAAIAVTGILAAAIQSFQLKRWPGSAS